MSELESNRPHRRVASLSLCSFCVSLLLLLLLPSILSTSWGGYCVQKLIRTFTALDVKWESCSIGWFSDTHINQLTLRTRENELVFHAKSIDSTWRPSSLFFTPRSIGITTIHKAHLDLSLIVPQTEDWPYPLNPASFPNKVRLPFYGTLEVDQSTLDCTLATDKELHLRKIAGSISIPRRHGPILCAVTAASSEEEDAGKMALLIDYLPLSGRLLLHTHADAARALTEDRLHINMQVQQFPSLILDTFLHLRRPSSSALISSAVGPFFDCRIETHTHLPNPKLSLHFKSPALLANCHVALDQNELLFTTEKPISWQIPPELLDRALLSTRFKQQLTLQTSPALELSTSGIKIYPENDYLSLVGSVTAHTKSFAITAIDIPLEIPSCSTTFLFAPHTVHWNAQLGVNWNQNLSKLSSSGSYLLTQGLQEFELSLEALPTKLIETAVQQKELLEPFFGDVLALHLSAKKAENKPGYQLRSLFLSPKVQCDPIELFLGENITLQQPVEVRFTLPPHPTLLTRPLPVHFICEAFSLSKLKGCQARFAFPFGNLHLSLSDYALPLDSPASLKLTGKAVWSPRINSVVQPLLLPILTPTMAQFSISGADQTASIFFEPHHSETSSLARWHVTLLADHWMQEDRWTLDKTGLHLEGFFPLLNMHLLQNLLKLEKASSLLLGKEASLTFSANYDLTHETDASCALSLRGEGIETDLSCGWSHSSKRMDLKLAKFQWKLGKKRFAYLQELWPFLRDWTLFEDANLLFTAPTGLFSLSLEELKAGALPFPISVSSHAFTLLHEPSRELLSLSVAGFLDQNLRYQLQAHLDAKSGLSPSKLLLEGSLKEVASANNQTVNTPSMLTCQFQGDHLPTSLLATFFYTKPDLYALASIFLGTHSTIQGSFGLGSQNKQLDLKLSSISGLHLELSAIGEENSYRLKQPCIITLPLTLLTQSMEPFLADSKTSPLLSKMVRFSKILEDRGSRLSIKISPEESFLKLPYESLDDIKIGLMTIQTDQIAFQLPQKNSEMFSILPKELKEGKLPITLEMTPLFLSLNQGTLELKRADLLLAGRYPLAFWGKANLIENKVKATLAISAIALKSGYQLHDIPSHYFLLLPMSGSLQKISLHKTKAFARLTALSLRSGGGIPGAVLGSLAHWLAGGADSTKIPPPTAPIPWEFLETDEPAQEGKQKTLPGQLIAPFKAVHRAVQKSVQNGADLLFNLFN